MTETNQVNSVIMSQKGRLVNIVTAYNEYCYDV